MTQSASAGLHACGLQQAPPDRGLLCPRSGKFCGRIVVYGDKAGSDDVADLTEGQVQLAVGFRRELCLVEQANSLGNPVFRPEVGVHTSLPRTASGRAYLLGLPDEEREAYLRDLRAADPQRATWLDQRLGDARRDLAEHGFCRSHGDLHRELESIAVAMSRPQDGELWVFAVTLPIYSPLCGKLETEVGPRLRTLVRSVESVLGASGLS
ncbi:MULTISPECIES: IclR family transcriptional regulator domain-containing protein [unclassified Acidovorax]|jgi:DNA-binding IclR family transcriptional regulator|uniref:IclR family transcriptional regulator domain-containing protein n=1 Tax=unclassified Acidovorax TaxID=2684926 RepID=UPI001E4D291F|nr:MULTISPECIES: hypothetical protein [unclassified Acidovorax]